MEQLQNWKDNITRLWVAECYDFQIDSNNQRRWDDSVLSKEKADALFMSRSQQIRIENSKWKMEAGPTGGRELEYLDPTLTSNLRQKDDNRRKQLKLRNVKGQSKLEGLDSPTFVPRGSIHHRRQCSLGDHNSLSSSPVVPTYMNATESYSPYKNKLFLISSVATEVPSGGWIGKTSGF